MAPSCDVVNAEVCSCVHFAQSKLRSVCVGVVVVVVGGGITSDFACCVVNKIRFAEWQFKMK